MAGLLQAATLFSSASTSGRGPAWAPQRSSPQLSRLGVQAQARSDGLQPRATASPVPVRPLGPPGLAGGGPGGGPGGGAASSSGSGVAPPGAAKQSGNAAAQQLGASKSEEWLDLLQTPEPDMFGTRARSASDAAVLRRKGHLKEQDKFIQFVLDMHQTHTTLEVGAGGTGGWGGALPCLPAQPTSWCCGFRNGHTRWCWWARQRTTTAPLAC